MDMRSWSSNEWKAWRSRRISFNFSPDPRSTRRGPSSAGAVRNRASRAVRSDRFSIGTLQRRVSSSVLQCSDAWNQRRSPSPHPSIASSSLHAQRFPGLTRCLFLTCRPVVPPLPSPAPPASSLPGAAAAAYPPSYRCARSW